MKKAYKIFKKIVDIFGTIIDTVEKVIKVINISRFFKKEDD